MSINWKIRFKNPMFYIQLVLALITPILAYAGLTAADITTWSKLGDLLFGAVSNPYVLTLVAASAYNAIVDPTSTGVSDSAKALDYSEPNSEK